MSVHVSAVESLKLEIVSRIEQNRVTEPTNKFEFCGNRTDFMWKGTK